MKGEIQVDGGKMEDFKVSIYDDHHFGIHGCIGGVRGRTHEHSPAMGTRPACSRAGAAAPRSTVKEEKNKQSVEREREREIEY